MESWTRIAVRAGYVPLIWFIGFLTVAGFVTAGYSPIASHASELSLVTGSGMVLFKIAVIGSGTAYVLFAAGLWRRTNLLISWGAVSWMAFGISMISNGLWPMGNPLHGLYALGLLSLVAPALSAIETPALRQDRITRAVTAFCSLCGVLYLWMNLTGHDPEIMRGLTQRVFSSINSLWPFVAAWRLSRSEGAA